MYKPRLNMDSNSSNIIGDLEKEPTKMDTTNKQFYYTEEKADLVHI